MSDFRLASGGPWNNSSIAKASSSAAEFLIVTMQTLINIIIVAVLAAQHATRLLVWFA
jgi:hypothetical protein